MIYKLNLLMQVLWNKKILLDLNKNRINQFFYKTFELLILWVEKILKLRIKKVTKLQ